MRKTFPLVFAFATLVIVGAVPASACYSRCQGNACVTGEIKTYAGCYVDNGVCYDVPYPWELCIGSPSETPFDALAPAASCGLLSDGGREGVNG